MKKREDDALQKVLAILEEEGKTFEEKKKAAICYLEEKEDSLLANVLISKAEEDAAGLLWKKQFWKQGEVLEEKNGVLLRKTDRRDKENFLKLQEENPISRTVMNMEACRDMLWKEHVENKTLICTIESSGVYVGYCGIKNLAKEPWEIAVELLKKWHRKGIGFLSICILLDAIKDRLGVTEFRVCIESDNYASQRLFEKLGAEPNGISEFLIHGEENLRQVEEENLSLINENLKEIARKFNVEPRKLLSHVLEYRLIWGKE